MKKSLLNIGTNSSTKLNNANMEKVIVDKIWLTDNAIWIRTADGREACENFADYQRLKWATPFVQLCR